MEGPFKFCLGPLEIQMVEAQDPRQKTHTESLEYTITLVVYITKYATFLHLQKTI